MAISIPVDRTFQLERFYISTQQYDKIDYIDHKTTFQLERFFLRHKNKFDYIDQKQPIKVFMGFSAYNLVQE